MRHPSIALAALALPLLLTGLRPAAAPAQSPPDSGGSDGPAAPDRDAAPLVADRPDFTESALSVEPGRVQVESGYTVARRDGGTEHAVGEVLARVGLADPVELRLAPNSYRVLETDGGTARGLADPTVGAKATLLEPGPDADPALPSVALLASTSLPAGDEAVSPGGAEPEALLALGWDLAPVSVGANLGHARALHDGERFGRTAASAAVGLPIGGDLDSYLEYYTLRPAAPGSGAEDVVNGGLTLLLSPDAQLDARAGAGLGGGAPELILGAGLSLRR